MNDGSDFLVGRLLEFNGGLFAEPVALPLTRRQLDRLARASSHDWSDVEPAIFGTLLERALDPRERHHLGAHFTPRAYVERLVKPTIEEPLRRDWDLVQAQVRRLVEEGKDDEARRAVHEFRKRLATTRVLDPACGSGNFLYVALDLFKRLESEVVGLLLDLGEDQTHLEIEGETVTPEQFRGIEVKRWAREIAELVLWIGYLRWQVRTYGGPTSIPQPVLRDYGNIEHRDAVLAWDGEPELVRDEAGEVVTHWDGVTTRTDPVTGEEVPDEAARTPVFRYRNARRAVWPRADFVVGNPPFIGNWRMRGALGHGYTETLRRVVPEVPASADYVMYWWHHAAELLAAGKIRRFGLITTNSVTQKHSRQVLARHLGGKKPISLVFAVPDHPWVDSEEGAAVRIAMTVAEAGEQQGILARVVAEKRGERGEQGERAERQVVLAETRGKIHSDLTVGPDVAGAVALRANTGLSCAGRQASRQGLPGHARASGGAGTRTRAGARGRTSGRISTAGTCSTLRVGSW